MNIFYSKDEIQNNPSIKSNLDNSLVDKYRKQGSRFLIDLGNKLGLRYDTIATGVVYFHRFFMNHSFTEFDKYVVAAGCLFLAGKVEETPKKAKDLIKTAKTILSDEDFLHFKDDSKEELMMLEKILLQTIRFDFNVPHPYTYLLKYIKALKALRPDMSEDEHKKLQKIVQMTWTFINDSLCTTLSLQWESEVIAVALIHLTSRLTKVDLSQWFSLGDAKETFNGDVNWWGKFISGLDVDVIDDICHQVMDLYSPKSKSTFSKSETAEMELLKRRE